MEERIDEDEKEFAELDGEQRVALGKWFLLNAPPGQVQQVARGIPSAASRSLTTTYEGTSSTLFGAA